MGMARMLQRIFSAALLNPQIYKEVEADQQASRQALVVVLLSSMAAGIAYFPQGGLAALIAGTLLALLGWYIWAELIYLIGVRSFPAPQTRTSHRQLLRTLGFASAPGILRVVGLIPRSNGVIFLLATIWTLLAMIVATRQACHYSSLLRAFLVCIFGWVLQLLLLLPMVLFFG